MRLIPCRLATAAMLLVLAGCAADEAQLARDDPAAYACRQRLHGDLSVPFKSTRARPVSRDYRGLSTYTVRADGRSFRCILDRNNVVMTMAEM